MSAVRLVTISPGAVGGGDDAAGRRIARALQADGIPVASRQVVDEEEGALEPALAAALGAGGLVVVLAPPSGSAGDVVRRVASRLTGARLVLNDKLLALLEADFAVRGRAMPRRQDRLALLPHGAQLWPAPGGEPAWVIETKDAVLAVLPLGSAHLDLLVAQHLQPLARERLGCGETAVRRTLLTTGVDPASLEERLAPWLGKDGAVGVSCLVVEGDVWVRLLARGASRRVALAALGPVESAVREVLGEDCYGRDDDCLEAVLGRLLLDRGWAVSVAESCTGGLVGHRLTNIPGSSRYVERAVVAYSNRAKEELLGVPADLLRAHGAVSAPVAEAMARGICRVSGSPCGLAVTGIAGPDGGTPEKPVGTVFVAAAVEGTVDVRRFRFAGTREAIKWQASQAALDLLRRAVLRRGAAP